MALRSSGGNWALKKATPAAEPRGDIEVGYQSRKILSTSVDEIIVQVGCDTGVVAASALLDMYAKGKRFDESLRVFQAIPDKNSVSWSAIIAGCVLNNLLSLALKFFKEMQKVNDGVSQSIYASVLRSCAALSELRLGGQLHAHALKSDFATDGIVRTATLDWFIVK